MKWLWNFRRARDEMWMGMAYMLISSVLLSLFSLFGKFAIEETPFFLLTALRFIIPLLIMIPYFLWTSSFKELFLSSNFKLQLLRALCMLVYQYTIFYYLTFSSLLNATILQNTFPLFLPILEKLFFKHHFNKREIVSILICFAGVLCILQPDRGILEGLSLFVILAPLSQAGSQMLYAHQARQENQKSTLFYLYFLCSIATTAIYFFSPEHVNLGSSMVRFSLWTWITIMCLGVVSIFNQYYRGKAYSFAKPSSLSPFLYFSLIVSGFLDWVIFHQFPNWLSAVGAFLVIAGGMIQLYERKTI